MKERARGKVLWSFLHSAWESILRIPLLCGVLVEDVFSTKNAEWPEQRKKMPYGQSDQIRHIY